VVGGAGHRPVGAAEHGPGEIVAEHRRGLPELGQLVLDVRGVVPRLVVGAVDGDVGGGDIAVPAVLVAPVQRVRQRHEDPAVAVVRLHQTLGEVLPEVLRVQRLRDAAGRGGLGEFAGEDAGDGSAVEVLQQPGDAVLDVLGAVPEGALLDLGGAVLGEVVEGELETLGLTERALFRGLGRVDDRVEDGAAHVLGEQVGVDAAEFGAVRDAEVVQLVVAENLAHQVHVAGRVGRGHVRQHPLGVLLAGGVEVLRVLQQLSALGRVVRGGVLLEVGVELLVVQALHGGAAPHAARVEADQVVAGAQFRVVLAEGGQCGDAGSAGSAEIEDE
jgi:hypothetical protein